MQSFEDIIITEIESAISKDNVPVNVPFCRHLLDWCVENEVLLQLINAIEDGEPDDKLARILDLAASDFALSVLEEDEFVDFTTVTESAEPVEQTAKLFALKVHIETSFAVLYHMLREMFKTI